MYPSQSVPLLGILSALTITYVSVQRLLVTLTNVTQLTRPALTGTYSREDLSYSLVG